MPAMITSFVLLATLAQGAVDVAVVDRGGGPERVAAALAGVPAVFPGGTLVPAADVVDLDRQYIVPCGTDDACLVRTMASIAVGAIVFVEPGALVVIERVRLRSRRQPAPTLASIGQALDDAVHPERFGTLVIEGAPPDATVHVDGVPWSGGDVLAGQRQLLVEAPGHAPRELRVSIPPAGTASVMVSLTPRPQSSTPAPAPMPSTPAAPTTVTPPLGIALTGIGAGVAAMGLVTGVLGEVQAAGVVAALRQGERRDDLGLWEAVEITGFAVAIAGGVAAVAGGLMLASGEPPSPTDGG